MEENFFKEFQIASRVFVKPKPARAALNALVNFALVFTIVSALFEFFFDGFSVRGFGQIAVAIVIVERYNSAHKASYKGADLEMSVTNSAINLIYHNVPYGKETCDMTVSIPGNSITTIEHGLELKAVRVVGDITCTLGKKVTKPKDWVIYAYDDDFRVADALSDAFGIPVNELHN